MMWNDGPDGWAWVLMAFMMILFWGSVLVGVIWFARQFGRPATQRGDLGGAQQRDARETARDAYARGEYGRERFLEIMEDLQGPLGGKEDEPDAER